MNSSWCWAPARLRAHCLPSWRSWSGSAAPSRWWASSCRPATRSTSTAQTFTLTLASLFIAQAMGFELTWGQQGTILLVALLTSKGASGISGAGFITLAATLATVNPALVPGMAILLGIDKFMSECRALVNFTGNGVATVVVAWWEGELDRDKLNAGLSRQVDPSDVEAAVATG